MDQKRYIWSMKLYLYAALCLGSVALFGAASYDPVGLENSGFPAPSGAWDEIRRAELKAKVDEMMLSGDVKIPAANETFKALSADKDNPFAISFGTSMSQTHRSDNTVSPEYMRVQLQKVAKTMPVSNAEQWLKHKDRYRYALSSLPIYSCADGHKIDPSKLDTVTDKAIIDAIFKNLAKNRNAHELSLTECPDCQGGIIEESFAPVKEFGDGYQQALIAQLKYLGVFDQSAYQKNGLPNVRLSLEASDILKFKSKEIDPGLLSLQANFINALGNPMLFFHHYSNPIAIPNLFEEESHADWFANYCVKVLEKSPQVTHVCPISQPIGFGMRVHRQQNLPPFVSNVSRKQYFDNIVKAQLAAARAIKVLNPKIQVLVSHQWKPMKPKHNSFKDPRIVLEKLVCSIGGSMYNGKFVELMGKHMDDIDGIALSIYPTIYFNLWAPDGDNCAGMIDFPGAMEAILETAKAFPGKDIYVVETGCNTLDEVKKRQFIDMTLYACRMARDLGVPVKGVYFWGITNDPDFYMEWNSMAGSTHFAPFDRLDLENPVGSINAAGRHIKSMFESGRTLQN